MGRTKPSGESHEGSNVAGNLEKVKEILMGEEMRASENRIAALQNELEQERRKSGEALRATDDRIGVLETGIAEQFKSLTQHFDSEQSKQSKALRDLAHDLLSTTQSLEGKIEKLNKQLDQRATDISEKMDAQTENFMALLEHHVAQLQADKVDASSLASALTQLADRLTNGVQVSG